MLSILGLYCVFTRNVLLYHLADDEKEKRKAFNQILQEQEKLKKKREEAGKKKEKKLEKKRRIWKVKRTSWKVKRTS